MLSERALKILKNHETEPQVSEIRETKRESDSIWTCQCKGQAARSKGKCYDISVTVSGTSITSSSCTCEYGKGEVNGKKWTDGRCKHVAALLFLITKRASSPGAIANTANPSTSKAATRLASGNSDTAQTIGKKRRRLPSSLSKKSHDGG